MTQPEASSEKLSGIPYARVAKHGKKWGKVCPVCNKWIVTRERKDFESFTGREYAEHYQKEHSR